MCQCVDIDYHSREIKRIEKDAKKSPFKGALEFYKYFNVDEDKDTLTGFYRNDFTYSPGWNLPNKSGRKFQRKPRVDKTLELAIVPTSDDMQQFNVYGGVFHALRLKRHNNPYVASIYALPSDIAFLSEYDVTLYAFYIKPSDYRRLTKGR